MSEMRQPQPGPVARRQQSDASAPWAPAPAASDPDIADQPGDLYAVSERHADQPGDPYAVSERHADEPAGPYAAAERHGGQALAARAVGVAAVPQPDTDIVPAEIYQVRTPERGPASGMLGEPAFVARIPTSVPVHRPAPGRSRLQTALATAVALAGLATVGIGWVAFTHPGRPNRAQAPVVDSTPPAGSALPSQPGAPRAKAPAEPAVPTPVGTRRTRTATTADATATAPAVDAGSRGGVAAEDAPVPSADSGSANPSARVLRPPPPAPSPMNHQLGATLTFDADRTEDGGLTDYAGTIRIDNSGVAAVDSWQILLTVPGGNKVTSRGPVLLAQDGESVVFTPAGSTGVVAAGGSLRFTFAVRGVLSGPPTGCSINGRACD